MGRHAYILVGNFGKVTDGFARKGRVMVRVSVVGAKGRMGSHVVDAVNGAQDMQLAFALDAGDDLMRITPENTDVVVEFTVPSVSLDNVLALVKRGVDVVVGTTGWTDERLAKVTAALAEAPRGDQAVFIAPNFAISAVLADYFAKVAAPYFESAEVIELHHPTKVDAPSGTAIHTARAIADAVLGTLDLETVTEADRRAAETEAARPSVSTADTVTASASPHPTPPEQENPSDTPETFYRVQTGLFRIRQNADRMLYDLLDQGYPAFLLAEDGFFKVQVGAYRQLGNAILMERRLRRDGYSTLITT